MRQMADNSIHQLISRPLHRVAIPIRVSNIFLVSFVSILF